MQNRMKLVKTMIQEYKTLELFSYILQLKCMKSLKTILLLLFKLMILKNENWNWNLTIFFESFSFKRKFFSYWFIIMIYFIFCSFFEKKLSTKKNYIKHPILLVFYHKIFEFLPNEQIHPIWIERTNNKQNENSNQ